MVPYLKTEVNKENSPFKKKLSNSLKMEITQMFINRGMDKPIVVYQ